MVLPASCGKPHLAFTEPWPEHPSIIYDCLYYAGSQHGAYTSWHWVKGGVRPVIKWTSHQFITGLTFRDKQAHMPTGYLESPIDLICMSLYCGGTLEYPE